MNPNTPKQAMHSPLPWKYKDEEHGNFSITSGQQYVTDVSYWDKPGEPQKGWLSFDQAEANAAFIVQAVNCHEELVSRLRAAQEWIERARTILSPDQQGFCGFNTDKSTKEFLAKASEGRD